jgi:hypothetical protein
MVNLFKSEKVMSKSPFRNARKNILFIDDLTDNYDLIFD